MKIIITGTSGIALAAANCLKDQHSVDLVGRSTGHDLAKWSTWVSQIYSYDVFINNAQQGWHQAEVLVHMAQQWRHHKHKIIITVGSKVTDYARAQGPDHVFYQYRVEKRTLQDSFVQLSQTCDCRLVLINPGITDTELVRHMQCSKLSPGSVAKYIKLAIDCPEIRRLDIWQ